MYNWDKITREDLVDLWYRQNKSDYDIAQLYGVSEWKVKNKRKKLGVNMRSCHLDEIMAENSDAISKLNIIAKKRLENDVSVDKLAKALTHYLFRNGPVEDMHSNHQLSENDMMVLNKFMVNRVAGLIKEIKDGNWLRIQLLLGYYYNFGGDWDPAEPDTHEIDFAYKSEMDAIKEALSV